MGGSSNPFNVIKKNWKVGDPFGGSTFAHRPERQSKDKLRVALRDSKGDQREVPAAALEALRGTDAYDSYEQLYHIDGRRWRVEGRMSRADGKSFYVLRCVEE